MMMISGEMRQKSRQYDTGAGHYQELFTPDPKNLVANRENQAVSWT
jgi:hypothetical protein